MFNEKRELKCELADVKSKYLKLDVAAAGMILLIRNYLNPYESDTTLLEIDKAAVEMECLQKVIAELKELKIKMLKLEAFND